MIKVLAFGILLVLSTAYAATTLVADTVAAVVKVDSKSRLDSMIK